ncbi:uncharacterized protein LOC136037275 [Artemia franciscana]|uniref:uncharacterized protein LOC136037275 n=1 Tax=Artemia franciscana TaxID=6661 RepID=UPI0032DA5FEA
MSQHRIQRIREPYLRSFKLLSTKMWNFVFFARRSITVLERTFLLENDNQNHRHAIKVMEIEIMKQMSSYAPVQSPGPSPLYPASVTLSVGTSRKSPMSQTAIHSSQTQRSQHKYMSRFHTNIFQL